MATSVLLNYCSVKGYTSVIEPTILSTGACSVLGYPTATVTAYVTQYVNQRSSAASDSLRRHSTQAIILVAFITLFLNVGVFARLPFI